MPLSHAPGLGARRGRQRDAVAGRRARRVGRAAPVPRLQPLLAGGLARGGRGGNDPLQPRAARRRAASRRSIGPPRCAPTAWRASRSTSDPLRERKMECRKAGCGRKRLERSSYCIEHLIADRFGRHLARLDPPPRQARRIGGVNASGEGRLSRPDPIAGGAEPFRVRVRDGLPHRPHRGRRGTLQGSDYVGGSALPTDLLAGGAEPSQGSNNRGDARPDREGGPPPDGGGFGK